MPGSFEPAIPRSPTTGELNMSLQKTDSVSSIVRVMRKTATDIKKFDDYPLYFWKVYELLGALCC